MREGKLKMKAEVTLNIDLSSARRTRLKADTKHAAAWADDWGVSAKAQRRDTLRPHVCERKWSNEANGSCDVDMDMTGGHKSMVVFMEVARKRWP
jgi:hypothetical protein